MEKIEIIKLYYANGFVSENDAWVNPGYEFKTKLGDRNYSFVKIYEADSHSGELEGKFKEEALIAFENKKKNLNG